MNTCLYCCRMPKICERFLHHIIKLLQLITIFMKILPGWAVTTVGGAYIYSQAVTDYRACYLKANHTFFFLLWWYTDKQTAREVNAISHCEFTTRWWKFQFPPLKQYLCESHGYVILHRAKMALSDACNLLGTREKTSRRVVLTNSAVTMSSQTLFVLSLALICLE